MNENIDIDYSYFQSINKQTNKQKMKFYNNKILELNNKCFQQTKY